MWPLRKKLKILMIPTLNMGCVYYRMQQFVEEMRRMGHEVAYSYHPPDYTGTCQWEHNVDEKFVDKIEKLMDMANITIFQPTHTLQALAVMGGLKERLGKPILAEYDDDIFAVPSYNLSYRSTKPGSDSEWWNRCQIADSDGVIVSTNYLKKRYSQLNKKVFVVPNAINFNLWDNAKRGKEHKRIRIGWVGGASHSSDLRLVKSALLRILKEHKNVEVLFHMGGLPEKWMSGPRFKAAYKWFTIDKYPQGFVKYNFDIGIAPLRDTDFNRAKSNLKFLEFGAAHVPIVASNTAPYKETIEHGKTGFLATEPDEWYHWLNVLIDNETERKKMGDRAYNLVKKKYNIHRSTKKYIAALRRFI